MLSWPSSGGSGVKGGVVTGVMERVETLTGLGCERFLAVRGELDESK